MIRSAQSTTPSSKWLGVEHLRPIREDFRQYAQELVEKYGDIIRFSVFGNRIVLCATPELAHEVLVGKAKSFRKPDNQKRVLGSTLGNVSVIMDGASWSRRRRILSPVFAPEIIRRYGEIVTRQARDVFAGMKPGVHDIVPAMSNVALMSVAEALFGAAIRDVASDFHRHVMVQQRIVARRIASPFRTPLWIPTRDNRALRKSMAFFNKFVEQLIAERRASQAPPDDLLSTLLAATDSDSDQGLSNNEARAEALTMLVAGNDTTAAALTWSAYLLAQDASVQRRLGAEIRDSQPSVQRPTATDAIDSDDYATAVFQEAMRLYPPAPVIARQATEPVVIGNVDIPVGSLVFILVYTIHRDGRWHANPNVFDPDRFLAHRRDTVPESAYLPFGLGPRACIGRRFAMMEGRIVIRELVSQFRLALPKDAKTPELETQLSLHPKGGLRLALQRRQLATNAVAKGYCRGDVAAANGDLP